jgi:phosphatidylglycerophosphatase GEP4
MTSMKIGQYFNIDGIKLSIKYLLKLNKIKPDLSLQSVTDLNPKNLKNTFKVKYIVFDKDNTLTLPHKTKFANDEIELKLREFQKVFGNNNISILSNSAGSRDDKEYREAEEIEFNTQIRVIRHQYKKPNVYKEIKETFQLPLENNKGQNNKDICIVGDRLLVDIIMGYEYNFFTILVQPINTKKENFVVRQLRKFEKFLLNN